VARRAAATPEHAARVDAVARRIDEPLRVAIAGKVKAGKSTLLNALVGDELAATDAGECTRIVTWYRHGLTYRVLLEALGATTPVQVPFHRDGGAVDIDLGGRDASTVERLTVEWPAPELEQLTLIDTPGLGSISKDISERAVAFLTPDDERETPADAVLYLMRHLHTADLRFLEAFHDHELAQPMPVNAIAVLSRADEIAVGRPDAMASAARIATRYRADPKVRRLVQTVVPVAGLLAQSGSSLREAEFQALTTLARLPVEDTDALLLSADRFVAGDQGVGLTDLERAHLLDRFGLFGVRLALQLVRGGKADTARTLSSLLVRHSGLDQLRHVLHTQFTERADLLKARSALLGLSELARATTSDELATAVERVQAGAHELTEIRVLNALRVGAVAGRRDELADLERLLGADGATVPARLALDDGAGADEVRTAATEQLGRWQRRAENPMTGPDLQDACRVAIRTCEGLLAAIP
jgi:predicted GTPase